MLNHACNTKYINIEFYPKKLFTCPKTNMSELILKGKTYQPRVSAETLGELFFNNCEKYKSNICHVDCDTGESETFKSVKERTLRLAISLQRKGINNNDVITTCSKNSLDSTIPIIATTYLGAKFVNLDPTLSVRSTSYLISLVEPKIIFADQESLSLIEKSLMEKEIKPEIIVLGKSAKYVTLNDLVVPSCEEKTFRPVKVDLNSTALMFFSSGSTGLPKAICHSHKSFISSIDFLIEGGFHVKSMLHFTTMYWISGVSILWTYAQSGGTRYFSNNSQGEHIFEMIEKFKIEAIFFAPIGTYELTRVSNPDNYDTSSLKFIYIGGAAISTTQQKNLVLLFPKTFVVFGYGLSETGFLTLFDYKTEKDLMETKLGSVGKLLPSLLLKIVDDSETVLGANQEGEIRIKSPSSMTGYYKMDSSLSFDEQNYLKTGDIGYYDQDGCIYVTGRKKEMFKYLSWHIVPSSIEQVLMEHPAVKESVVFGVPCEEKGEVPAACVVLHHECNVTKEELEKFVTEKVSDREKLRGGLIFMQDLPKTPTGKIIRNDVRNIFVKS